MKQLQSSILDYTVTNFIYSKEGKRLSTKRVLYHISERLKGYDIYSSDIVQFFQSPISIALCPTARCVRQCKFCSNTERNRINRKLGLEYSENIFNQIVNDLNKLNVLGVSVAGGGEPLLWNKKQFHKFLCQKNPPYKIGIHTNGVYLDNLFDNEIIKADNISYINVSVNAHNPILYKEITDGSRKQFLKIEKNFKKGIKLKQKYDNFPTFSVKIIICRENYKYVKEIREYFMKLDIPNILLRCAGNFEPNQDVELLRNQIKELKKILIAELKLGTEQIEAIIGEPTKKPPIPSRCWIAALKYTAGIDPDGEVYLCSPWSRKEYSIGNVNEKSFTKIWGSKKHASIIKELNKKLQQEECNPLLCRHYYSNLSIDAYINGILTALPKEQMKINYGRFI